MLFCCKFHIYADEDEDNMRMMVVTCGDDEIEEEEDNDDEDDGDDNHDDGILRKLLRQTKGTTKLEIEPVSQDDSISENRCPLRTLKKELSTQPHSPSKTRWLRLSRTLKSTLHLATWKGTEVGLAVSWCH